MRNLFLYVAFFVGSVHAREYFITKNQSDLVFDGRYLNELNNKGKEFWICVDYEAEGPEFSEHYGNAFPVTKCGGSPRTENNMYWYAIHGIWESENKLSIRFKSAFQLWPEFGDTNPKGSFFWTWRDLEDGDNRFRVIQTHGITNYGEKRPDIDTLLLIGGGSVHVRGVKDGTRMHIRVKSESETGITLEQVLETKYDHERHTFETPESPISSEETATQSSDSILPEKEEVLTEEVTSSPTQWKVIVSEPAMRRQDDEPFLLIRVPDLGDEGVQSRPTENIPFVEKKMIHDPVYDQSSEETRRSQQENEISEEEATTVSQTQTTEIITNPDNTLEAKHFYEPLVEIQDNRPEYDYQLLYTVAIGTAFGFFCFFILIVCFRCYAWDNDEKVIPAKTQQKSVVYTIGGTAPPVKVVTE